MRGILLTIGLCLAVAIAGCGGGDDSSSSSGAETAASAPQESINKKPVVDVPSGPPPTQLETIDLIEGSGPEAKAGDNVSVQYVLVDYKSGKEIESSWERNEPLPFTLGSNAVIPGWEQGVEGMKVGGRRELIIPPELAYGSAGSPPVIKPNATLIFVVDMVAIE